MTLWIGVAGYSTAPFNREEGQRLVIRAFDAIHVAYPDADFGVVSGLTDYGIPGLAYAEAAKRNWLLYGIACKKANKPAHREHWFQVNGQPIPHRLIGDEWGGESHVFVRKSDVFVRIGGGPQSLDEADLFRVLKGKGRLYEYPLDVID